MRLGSYFVIRIDVRPDEPTYNFYDYWTAREHKYLASHAEAVKFLRRNDAEAVIKLLDMKHADIEEHELCARIEP